MSRPLRPRHSELSIDLNAVIVAVPDDEPRILTVRSDAKGRLALPAGPLAPADRTLELALRGWVREQTGLELGYVEQLYTFGDRDRAPHEDEGRQLSIAYLALVDLQEPSRGSGWRRVYQFLPWEDRRRDSERVFEATRSALDDWSAAAASSREKNRRRERVEIAFSPGRWDEERVLDRYELLYEAELVAESCDSQVAAGVRSVAMALDHRRMLATALGRLRGKLKYRPVVFELLPPEFTLLQLQHVVEALSGVLLHKQNFRRLVERGGLVEGTGRRDTNTGGRPAELFQFRPEVQRERPTPGVGLPGVRSVDG